MREIEGIDFNEAFVPKEEYLDKRELELKPYSDIWERKNVALVQSFALQRFGLISKTIFMFCLLGLYK